MSESLLSSEIFAYKKNEASASAFLVASAAPARGNGMCKGATATAQIPPQAERDVGATATKSHGKNGMLQGPPRRGATGCAKERQRRNPATPEATYALPEYK